MYEPDYRVVKQHCEEILRQAELDRIRKALRKKPQESRRDEPGVAPVVGAEEGAGRSTRVSQVPGREVERRSA